jgi:hypothetical protein
MENHGKPMETHRFFGETHGKLIIFWWRSRKTLWNILWGIMIKGRSTTMAEGCTIEILSGKFELQFAMVQMAHEDHVHPTWKHHFDRGGPFWCSPPYW